MLFLIVGLSIQPLVFGTIELKENQKNLEIGQVIQTDRIVLEIQRDETVHVKHIIEIMTLPMRYTLYNYHPRGISALENSARLE